MNSLFKSIDLKRSVKLPDDVELISTDTIDPNIVAFASSRHVKDKLLYYNKVSNHAYFYSVTKDNSDRHSMIDVELLDY